jgi:hypothetical protein
VSSIISHKGLAFTKSVTVANSTIEATKEAAAVFMLTPVAASSIATPYVGVLSTESLPVLVSSIDASINEIADMVGGEKTHIPPREGEARHTLANTTKANTILGWNPTLHVRDWINSKRA